MRMAIAAAALTSGLGPLVTACAAFRAGVSAAKASRESQHFPEDGGPPEPLTTCAIPGTTFGFSGAGRLTAILHQTLEELGTQVPLKELAVDTPIFLALPDALERNFPMRAELEDDEERRCELLGASVLKAALEGLGLSWKATPHFFAGGQTAFAEALLAARSSFEEDDAPACLVLAVDSLLSPPTLRHLAAQWRLKVAANPVGFIPGEAGVAVLLRPAQKAKPRLPNGPRVFIDEVCVLEAEQPERVDGRDLAACVDRVLAARKARPEEPLLVGDHNGGERRAREWGSLLTHLRRRYRNWQLAGAWFPATSFGDTGAASAALGLCALVRGLERGYAGVDFGLILSSEDERAPRAAILVTSSSS